MTLCIKSCLCIVEIVYLLHWKNFAHEDPRYGHDSHRRKKYGHEKQRNFYPRRERRRLKYVSDDTNGQVTNRTSGHRAQGQKSLSQSVYGTYGQHITRDTKRHVHRLYTVNIYTGYNYYLFISSLYQFYCHYLHRTIPG